jgi:heme oxygenase (biliverdin-IX-beta and delta-forming)
MLRGQITSVNGTNLDSERQVTSSVSDSRMSEPRSTIDLLRVRTAKHHQDLESGLQIQNRLSQVETRDPLIAGYFAFYRETEAALGPHLWDMSELAFSSRVRSRRIPSKTGLPWHGMFLVNPVFPAIGTKAEAVGALYVLEGSTLGGQKILQALRSQGVSTDDLHFLDPYGKETGAHWRVFLRILERETAHSETTKSECILGALKAFAFAAMCLRKERTN